MTKENKIEHLKYFLELLLIEESFLEQNFGLVEEMITAVGQSYADILSRDHLLIDLLILLANKFLEAKNKKFLPKLHEINSILVRFFAQKQCEKDATYQLIVLTLKNLTENIQSMENAVSTSLMQIFSVVLKTEFSKISHFALIFSFLFKMINLELVQDKALLNLSFLYLQNVFDKVMSSFQAKMSRFEEQNLNASIQNTVT